MAVLPNGITSQVILWASIRRYRDRQVVIEVFAPEDGVLQSILKNEGETVLSEEPIAILNPVLAQRMTAQQQRL